MSIAFGTTRTLIRQRAGPSGFTPDQLDVEFLAFREAFGRRLFAE